jgi:hypothetical protein
MSNSLRLLGLLPVALLLASTAGCSFSYSSASSSKSSRSSSVSSSSSSPGHAQRSYENDVRDYTAAYIQSGGKIDAFRRKLAELAERHGLSDWEANLGTYEAIGKGLADADASQVQVDAFKDNLGGGDPAKAAAIQGGYDDAK